MREAIVAILLSLIHVVCLFGQDARTAPEVRASEAVPLVTLSTSDEVVSRGDRIRVWFGTSQNAHVSVFRIDTDGRVRMLYPERPWHNNYVQAGRMVEVKSRACYQSECAFVVDDYPGQGYLFAIVSTLPFEFDLFANGDYWDYTNMAHRGRVTGDPFRALARLMERVVPSATDNQTSYDVFEYHVEQRFAFPRFLCYECHSFVRFPSWNPYQQECASYRIIRYDGPAYHSASGYSPTRVVFSRPSRIEPRFIFTERVPGDSFVSIREERPAQNEVEAGQPNGATARVVGGIGAVPAPLGRRGTVSESDLRRLSLPDSSSRKGPTSLIRSITPSAHPKPRLLRRRKTKPDSSSKSIRITPDTSGTR